MMADEISDNIYLPPREETKTETAVRQLDAYQWSGYDSEKYSFGMDREKCASALRAIADRIESGEYVIQSGGVYTYANRDDYQMTAVTVKFHAKKVPVNG